jgi:hypothetical protein
MGCAELISLDEVRARKQWESLRQQLHARFDQWLDRLEEQWPEPAPTLAAVTETVWALRQALTGSLTETIVMHTHQDEYTRQQSHCPLWRISTGRDLGLDSRAHTTRRAKGGGQAGDGNTL